MKHSHLIRRLSAAALALLMLASLPACVSNPNDPGESGTNAPAESTTNTPTDSNTPNDETEPPVDPSEPDATLTPDNAVIVVSDYAASWEKSAAEALAAELGLTVVSDAKIPEGKTCLAVGYTSLNETFSGLEANTSTIVGAP